MSNEKIRVTVLDPSGSIERQVGVLITWTVERFVREFTKNVNLPDIDEQGIISYEAVLKRTGKALDPQMTIQDLGIQNGDTIRLRIRQECGGWIETACGFTDETLHKAQLKIPAERVTNKSDTRGDVISIPFTTLLPTTGGAKAYFYYLTDDTFSSNDSKYRVLDEELTLFGRYRRELCVVIVDRDRISPMLWDSILKSLDIKRYPVLIVSSESLSIENAIIRGENHYTPPRHPLKVAKFEAGILLDNVLRDRDEIRALLNELFDAAREGIAEETLRKKKILELLKIVGKEIKDIMKVKF